MNIQKYQNGQGIFHVNRPVTTPASGTIVGKTQNNPTAFQTVLTSMGMPLEGTIKEPTAANFSNLDSRNEVGALDWQLRRNGYDGLTGAERVALRKYADAQTDYDRYLNRDSRFARRRGRRAQERIKKYEGQVTNLMDRMRNVTYDADGNAHQEYSEGYDPKNGFKTAEEANQYKAAAQKWADKDYMDAVDAGQWGMKEFNGTGVSEIMNQIKTLSGYTNDSEYQQAIKGNTWGAGSNTYYNNAIKYMLDKGDYANARGLANWMNAHKDGIQMYTPKSTDNFGNTKGQQTQLIDVSSQFTDDARQKYLNSDIGAQGFQKHFEGRGGYYSAYGKDGVHQSQGTSNEPARYQMPVAKPAATATGAATPVMTSLDQGEPEPAIKEVKFKQGGNLNMHNINKFQDGGSVGLKEQIKQIAIVAAQGDQRAQSALKQFVYQVLQSQDQAAMQAIQELAQEAESDQDAMTAMQAIQSATQEIQGGGQQAPSAKLGAKLNYIHRLNTGCPAGTELQYYKKGGHICKACVKKAKKAMEGTEVPEEKCGGKAKKKYFQRGGKTTKQDRFTKTINAVSPGEALYAPESQQAASRELFGTVGDQLNPASYVRRMGQGVRAYAGHVRQNVNNAYNTVTDPNASFGQKVNAVGQAAANIYLPGVVPAVRVLVGKHENGGELNAVIARNKKKYPQYDEDVWAGRKAVNGKYLNGDGKWIEGNKASKNQYGGLLTQLRSAYQSLNK